MEKVINFFKKYWLAFVIIIACFIVDMITKAIVTNVIEFQEYNDTVIGVKSVEVIKDFFWITYTRNTGAGWSMLSGKTTILIIITIVSIGFFVFLMKDYDFKKNTYYSLGLSLMLGGLFGNFVERIFRGYVTDFLDFVIFGYDFPVFNFADMCLVAGAISLIVALVITKEEVLEFDSKKPLQNQAEVIEAIEDESNNSEITLEENKNDGDNE